MHIHMSDVQVYKKRTATPNGKTCFIQSRKRLEGFPRRSVLVKTATICNPT